MKHIVCILAITSLFLVSINSFAMFRELVTPELYKDQSNWGDNCQGPNQSPIDLVKTDTKTIGKSFAPEVANFDTLTITPHDSEISRTFNLTNKPVITMNGKTYQALQFHAHRPAEHIIDGKHHDGELHIVLADSGSESPKEVIAIPLTIQEQDNATFDFLKPVNGQIQFSHADFNNLLKSNSGTFSYEGSLTTPPCSPHIQFYVREEPLMISEKQLRLLIGNHVNNNRDIQSLDGRTVNYIR